MPLDKIENIEEYVKTHESLVLHIKNNPVGCIIEENNENKSKYSSIEKKSLDFQTNYLDDSGFKFVNDFDAEIKKLIYFCKESFRVE